MDNLAFLTEMFQRQGLLVALTILSDHPNMLMCVKCYIINTETYELGNWTSIDNTAEAFVKNTIDKILITL